MSKEIKKCEYCGEELEAIRITKKFCSANCGQKKWREVNKEKVQAYEKKRYENHKEKAQARSKKWYEDNGKKTRDRAKKWRENNRERYNTNMQLWRKNNKERLSSLSRKSIYRYLGYPEEWIEVKELQYQIKQELKKQQENN